MFQGYFSWDIKKRPYHIQTIETAKERKQANKELNKLNNALKDQLKAE